MGRCSVPTHAVKRADSPSTTFSSNRAGCFGPTTRFARAVRERYRCLLIDEFQDTDPLQAELAHLLGDGSGQDDEVARLFVVGDPEQSIYRFRRADVAEFEATVTEMDERLELTSNFRSVPEILAFVDAVFAGLAASSNAPSVAHRSLHPVRSGNPRRRGRRWRCSGDPRVKDGLETSGSSRPPRWRRWCGRSCKTRGRWRPKRRRDRPRSETSPCCSPPGPHSRCSSGRSTTPTSPIASRGRRSCGHPRTCATSWPSSGRSTTRPTRWPSWRPCGPPPSRAATTTSSAYHAAGGLVGPPRVGARNARRRRSGGRRDGDAGRSAQPAHVDGAVGLRLAHRHRSAPLRTGPRPPTPERPLAAAALGARSGAGIRRDQRGHARRLLGVGRPQRGGRTLEQLARPARERRRRRAGDDGPRGQGPRIPGRRPDRPR